MFWRHLCLARAWSAAGLLTGSMLASAALAEPDEPAPSAGAVTETVKVLDARKAGDLSVEVRGNGPDRVRFTLHNTSSKRLNVVIPPGLVASSATGQPGGARGGGFQSMGLGVPTEHIGSFGQFRATNPEPAFQSVPASSAEPLDGTVTVPAGKTVELTVPSVCLNYGWPTPNLRNKFELMEVESYTEDPRARKALRTLATLGTSHGVAQAAMWHICNDLSYGEMVEKASKTVNPHEVALAARFVEALDASGDSEMVDLAYLRESRLFVQVRGDGSLAQEAKRLGESLDGLRILGLPVRFVEGAEPPEAASPAMVMRVTLSASKAGETRGQIAVSRSVVGEGWVPFGRTTFAEPSAVSVLDGESLARALDHAMASAFVKVKVARRGDTNTTLRVENHLPFTLANVVLKSGNSSGAAPVAFEGLGIGPARAGMTAIQAANGVVDRVELNGL